jgi:hypothetical protein
MQRPPDDALCLCTWVPRHEMHTGTLSLQLPIPKQRTLPPLQAVLELASLSSFARILKAYHPFQIESYPPI